MSAFECIACTSALEFIDTLSLSNNLWWQNSSECEWIFRGQSDTNYKLLPSIYRLDKYKKIFSALNQKNVDDRDMESEIANIVVSSLGNCVDIDDKNRLIEILKARISEISLIEEFLYKCNNVGLDIQSLKLFRDQKGERGAVEYFRNYMNDYIKDFYKKRDLSTNFVGYWELLEYDYPNIIALARHHGIPSRYLDWTVNPAIAAFFSALNSDGDGKICVWALNTKHIDSSFGSGQIRLHKNIIHYGLEYLHVQRGLFTDVIGYEGYYFKNGNWPTLDSYLADSCGNEWVLKNLKRIEIEKQFAPEVIKKLMRMDVSEYHLMPTYDNVAKSVIGG